GAAHRAGRGDRRPPPSVSLFRRRPASPPFPYTTLFRSRGDHRCTGEPPLSLPAGEEVLVETLAPAPREVESHPGAEHEVRHDDRDRKSTRLNSSHLGISYAVFCLKKKRDRHNAPVLGSS